MAVRQTQRVRFSTEDARRRLLFMGAMVALSFVGVWARLAYLQTVKAEELREAAQKYGGLRTHRWLIYGSRGQIKDRSGKVLAMDVPSLSVYVRVKAVTEPRLLAENLAPIVGMPPSSIEAMILRRRAAIEEKRTTSVSSGFFLERELVGEKASRLREAVARERERLRTTPPNKGANERLTSWLDGVDILDETRRWYPYGSIASTLIGFTSVDERGLAGIEWLLEQTLAASYAEVRGVLGASGQIVAGTRAVHGEPRNGRDVKLTIDVNVQNIAEQCLQEVMKKHQPAGACAVVMDVRNGDLLAVANVPHIDLNNREQDLREHGLGVMRNMATQFLYEPGSTFKPITVAAALEAHAVSGGSGFYCTGSMKVGKHTIRCAWHDGRRAHGNQNLKDVVARSCNTATARIGLKVGADGLYNAAQDFGLLQKSVIGSLAGRLEKPEKWPAIRTANVAFGQGIQVTPVGLAAAYAVIANDGQYVKPRLLLDEPTETRPVLSPQTASKTREYLQSVAEEGTGKLARVQGYTVAGKTGTAQKVIAGRRGYASGKYVASFVGFAPADNPRIVVLVVVDEPRNGYFGGTVAAPAFAQITEQVLTYLGVPGNSDEPDKRVASRTPKRTL